MHFGTRSADFFETELQRLLRMFRNKDGTVAVEAVVAVLDGSEPSNEVEAMLLIQMATTHALTMKLARQGARFDRTARIPCTRRPADRLWRRARSRAAAGGGSSS
jgi:hypothetical protein